MINLHDLKAVKKSYTKTSTKNQSFNELKFRRAIKNGAPEGLFTISQKIWEKLDLDNYGLIHLVMTEEGEVTNVVIGVVNNEDAVFVKETKRTKEKGSKGKSFKNVFLESALIDAGQLDKDEMGNQFLKLIEIPDAKGVEIGGITYQNIYHVVKEEPEEIEDQTVTDFGDL